MIDAKELKKNLIWLIICLFLAFIFKYPERQAPDVMISYGLIGFVIVGFMVSSNLFKSNKNNISDKPIQAKSFLLIAIIIFLVGMPGCIVFGNALKMF